MRKLTECSMAACGLMVALLMQLMLKVRRMSKLHQKGGMCIKHTNEFLVGFKHRGSQTDKVWTRCLTRNASPS